MFNQHVSAKYRRTLYGIMTIGAVFGAFATTNNAPGLQGDAPLAQTTEENVNSGDNDTEEPKLTVPGEFLGGDLDATEGSYFHKQFVAENSTLKNDYSKNQDVKVRITGAGVIGNTSDNDYFTYTFNCTQAGRYAVTAYVSTGNAEGSYKLTFDGTNEFTHTFNKSGWDTYVESTTSKVDLTEGVHTMRFTVLKGLNLQKFTFERTGDLPIQIDPSKVKNEVPGTFLGGDMDSEEGSYYNKQFVAEGSTLKNDYKANQDVKVRINGNGVVGNTSPEDFFTYYFNADKDGDYNVNVWCESSNNSTGKFTLSIDNGEATEYSFTGEGWGNQVAVPVELKNLEGGNHKMVFKVVSGLNLAKFEFTRQKTEADVRYELPCENIVAGNFDTDRGSYLYTGQFNTGDNKYAGNADVNVKMDANGKIGGTSKGDYFTYTLNCPETGDYNIAATVIASANDKEIKFTFHSANEQTATVAFTGKGWGDENTMEVAPTNAVHLEAGIHTMKVEMTTNGGVDLKSYKITKVPTTPTGIEAIQGVEQAEMNVYSIDGRYLRKADSFKNALEGLAPGIYIVGGKKVIKK